MNRGVVVFAYLAGSTLLYLSYALGVPNFPTFVALFFVTLILIRPRRAASPLTMFYLYYGAWYVVAPLFALRYQGDILALPEYSLALAFAYSVFGLGAIAICAGEEHGAFMPASSKATARRSPTGGVNHAARMSVPQRQIEWTIVVLYVVATASVALIVLGSGGLEYWLRAPGDAFLNRGGTGVYVVASHFSSLCLATLSGFYAYVQKRKLPIIVFLGWVAVTSPVHGSKYQISILIVLLFLPWLRDVALTSKKSIALFVGLMAVFFLGLYFRNVSWIDQSTIIPYALNYFTTLENLAISIRDFEPQFLMTFFLPFVKFMTPFGLSEPSMYFDMNHLLTDIYYPSAWAMRATEQWPVETDLYLNFFFFGGLPIVALFLYGHGYLYGYARRNNSLGAWFASIMLTMALVTHLRGSLYNHVDFYMYPFIAVVFVSLNGLEFDGVSYRASTALQLKHNSSPPHIPS